MMYFVSRLPVRYEPDTEGALAFNREGFSSHTFARLSVCGHKLPAFWGIERVAAAVVATYESLDSVGLSTDADTAAGLLAAIRSAETREGARLFTPIGARYQTGELFSIRSALDGKLRALVVPAEGEPVLLDACADKGIFARVAAAVEAERRPEKAAKAAEIYAAACFEATQDNAFWVDLLSGDTPRRAFEKTAAYKAGAEEVAAL